MSVTKQTTVWCDIEGCIEWYCADTGSSVDARHEASITLDWRYVNRKDLCGRHAFEAGKS